MKLSTVSQLTVRFGKGLDYLRVWERDHPALKISHEARQDMATGEAPSLHTPEDLIYLDI